MKIELVYPTWPKLPNQPEFHLPPHGPVCFAAALPADVEVSFRDENVQNLNWDTDADLVAISCMLTCQMPRGWEIARQYRERGHRVIFGGIGTMLHAEETMQYADSVLLGEAEGHMREILLDAENDDLKPLYDFLHDFPDTSIIEPARRDILDRDLYNFRGVQMVDLVHASRGCKFNCFPCCTPYLGGRQFRPRPIDNVVEEVAGIDNNRLFFVDNSLAQDDQWEKDLFRALKPLKKKWISHPIKDDDEILDLAADAGCWYVYQAIVNTSEVIANRVRKLKDRGIGVEGTILLGLDEHDEDYIKRLVDFLLELELDLAEFTILTPYPETAIRRKLVDEQRILHNDWSRYTCGETVFQPAQMSVDKLNELYQYAWDTFYADCSIEVRMAQLYVEVIKKEKEDGTYRDIKLQRKRRWGRDQD
ncbi:MAG: B12-binding domain-containing radical SAM protein [Planctomycetota bacterium]